MVEFFPSAPVVVSFGDVTVYWYGVLYVVAFGLAYILVARLQRWRGFALSRAQLLELITWGAVGVIAGGRLGYALLYEPLYYLQHPLEFFQLSQGGMSSHGGFVGVAIATWFFSRVLSQRRLFRPIPLAHSRRPSGGSEVFGPAPHSAIRPLAEADRGPGHRASQSAQGMDPERRLVYVRLLDVITVPAAFGLALGRVGNVVNHELYITPLAQAAAVGAPLIIALVCYWHLRRQTTQPGKTTGLFLVLYSLARFGEEYVRELDWPLISGWLTWGQVYTLPLFLLGLYLLKDEARQRHSRQS